MLGDLRVCPSGRGVADVSFWAMARFSLWKRGGVHDGLALGYEIVWVSPYHWTPVGLKVPKVQLQELGFVLLMVFEEHLVVLSLCGGRDTWFLVNTRCACSVPLYNIAGL